MKMRIGILGVNHKCAELKLREKLAKACARHFPREDFTHTNFTYVLLSTCNRTEIYFTSNDLAQTHTYLLNLLRFTLNEEFEHKIYSYFGPDCFLHLCQVTAGMDSAIVGETEIQGQVKRAYEEARPHRFLSSELHFIFQKSLKIGKEFRSLTKSYFKSFSLERSIEQAGYRHLQAFKNSKILFVGCSEINLKIFRYFKLQGFANLVFCNRSNEHVNFLQWEQMKEKCFQYDLVIFGTRSLDFLITTDDFNQEIVGQKLIIDVSVPRNVDPKIGNHPQIKVLNIDQLSEAVETKRGEIICIEKHLIMEAVEKQVGIFRSKSQGLKICMSGIAWERNDIANVF